MKYNIYVYIHGIRGVGIEGGGGDVFPPYFIWIDSSPPLDRPLYLNYCVVFPQYETPVVWQEFPEERFGP